MTSNLTKRDPVENARGTGHDSAVELVGVTKAFGGVVAVDAVSLAVRDGEFFSLLGPSGCGKTTTLRMIAGFDQPSEGRILVSGRDVAGVPAYRRNVNTVFQHYALFPHYTVFDNVAYGLRRKRFPKDEIRRRVSEALSMVALSGMGERRPKQLSGGQQQRVALARALILRPAVLLLDEPLGALDLKLRKQMQIELKRLQEQVGITFIYVTHDQEEALTMSDRIGVMETGRVLQVGTPKDIYDRPSSKFVADFIGDSNFLDGVVARWETGLAMVDFGCGKAEVTSTEVLPVGQRVSVAVRPERVEVIPDHAAGGGLAGRVERVVYAGASCQIRVSLRDGTIVDIRRPSTAALLDDVEVVSGRKDVWVSWRPEHAKVLQ